MSGSGRVALIIGHRGQDGTLLREILEKDGASVVGVGRPGSRLGASEEQVEAQDFASIEALVGSTQPSEIYYLAAHHGSSESIPATVDSLNIRSSWETHVSGFENTLNAARSLNPLVPVVLASSSLIYAPSDGLIDESSVLSPDTVYGLTKAAAVLLARARARQGQPVHILHLFPHESGLRDEAFVASKIVRTALRIAAGSQERLIIGDPTATVDWSLAREVVQVMKDVAQMRESQELVVGSGRESSVLDLAKTVFSELGLEVAQHVETDPTLLKRPSARRIANTDYLQSLFPRWHSTGLQSFAANLVEDHLRRLQPQR